MSLWPPATYCRNRHGEDSGGVSLRMGRSRGLTAGPASKSPDVPPELAARALDLVRTYPECFWYWRPDVSIRSEEDVRLVIRQLREYGTQDAWRAAQDLTAAAAPVVTVRIQPVVVPAALVRMQAVPRAEWAGRISDVSWN